MSLGFLYLDNGKEKIRTGMTTNFCVVGSPIQHSLSPAIHRAAYTLLGLNFSYDKLEVPTGELKKVLEDKALSGISVTMPLKYEAFGLAESTTAEATMTGVVNTLVRTTAGWIGHNTDVYGFEKVFQLIPRAESITILGSGATARSAALAISRVFPKARLSVVGRTAESVTDIVEKISEFGIEASAAPAELTSVTGVDLVVSTVPGLAFSELWVQIDSAIKTHSGFLFDVAYDPWPSPASSAWGEKSISGLDLLIWQAIEQVKLFVDSTGAAVEVPDQELYQAMKFAAAQQTGLK